MTRTGFPETRSAEQDFLLLADNAPVMIWRSGADRRTVEQERGFGWAQGIHPEDRGDRLGVDADAFDRRAEFSSTYRLRRNDGAYRWILDNGRPYRVADGTFLGYFGSAFDVTDQKRAEQQLEHALAEREMLLREVQHRVRNNMQLVLSFVTLFNRHCAENADIKRLSTHLQVLGEMQQYLHAH